MCRYFFDIKDGNRLVDPAGLDCASDADAIEKAKVIAIAVALGHPQINPKRHIAVIDDAGHPNDASGLASGPA